MKISKRETLVFGSRLSKVLLQGITLLAALVYLFAQNGTGACPFWNYQPEIPENSDNFSINEI
ncbi:cyclic lactone autoinducer peptide [Acetobacterium carbinolicum]|uniref:cyclic lactone autoinducer peptide n=1 Tax=Acetobacterium carbinolicum TaxID=52690 RepID=UPI0039C97676